MSDNLDNEQIESFKTSARISNRLKLWDIGEYTGYTVYGHLVPNGKWYFGITKRKPLKRWGGMGQNYKSSPRFYSAIKKYGWNNIQHHIVGTGFTKDEACHLEKTLISEYGTLGSGGYNCTEGGDGLHGHKFSKQSLLKMRISHLGQKSFACKPVYCVETGEQYESAVQAGKAIGAPGLQVAAAARGAKPTCRGFHWAYVGQSPKRLDSKPAKKPVYCIEDDEYYESLSLAGKENGVSPQAIRYAALNAKRTCKGKHWRFL